MHTNADRYPVIVRQGLLLILLMLASPLWAASWQLLPDESWFRFAVRAENTPVEGEFQNFSISMDFDPGQPESARLEVVVHLAGAHMQDEDINAAIAGSDWFAIAEFPRGRYVSEKNDRD